MMVVDENCDGAPSWREVHAKLLSLRARRAQLDHEEMIALRDAVRVQVWREVGAASMRDYLERVVGYGPRAANERLRVAGVLDAMPVLAEAMRSGELPYSAVREISRVATSVTEDDWVDACRGKNLRQIEALVSQRAPGDAPDSPPRPELQKFVVRVELTAAEYASWRQARQQIQEEHDERLDDSRAFGIMCAHAIEGPTQALEPGKPTKAAEVRRGRAKYQIAVTICSLCKQGWQHAGGRLIAIEPPDVARALCNAQRIGSLVDADGHAVQGAPRLTQDIPPKTRRFVLMRDANRCTVPGCRSSRYIEVHHLDPRALGGDHSPANLTCLCGGHHDALHRGTLIITGSAPNLRFEFREQRENRAHVDSVPRNGAAIGAAPDNGAMWTRRPPAAIAAARRRPCSRGLGPANEAAIRATPGQPSPRGLSGGQQPSHCGRTTTPVPTWTRPRQRSSDQSHTRTAEPTRTRSHEDLVAYNHSIMSAAIRAALVREAHRFIADAANEGVAKVQAALANSSEPVLLSYPPGDNRTNDDVLTPAEASALAQLATSDVAMATVRKLLREAAAAPLFHLFCLLEGVGDPQSWNGGTWVGADLVPPGRHEHRDMLHDASLGSYWDFIEAER